MSTPCRISFFFFFFSIVVLHLGESRSRFFPPDRSSTEDPFVSILLGVLRTSRSKDAILILREETSSRGQTSDILSKISAVISQRVPTLYVNACRTQPEFQFSLRSLSRDLVVYVYISRREPGIAESELIAGDVSRLAEERVRPKVLVLMMVREACRELASFFRAMWLRNVLDTIVVEYSGPSRTSEHRSTIVHRYDPFVDHLTEEPYSLAGAKDVAWFTDDFPNMRGYPLVHVFVRRLPYTDVLSDSTGKQQLKGVDLMVIDTLAKKMNFTDVFEVNMRNIYFEEEADGTKFGVVVDLMSGKYDALLNVIPMFWHPQVQYSDSILIEKWCVVVPKLRVQRNLFSTAVQLFISSFSIVAIFWVCSRLLQLNRQRWHPVRIVGIMLTSSFPPAPTRFHERILFLSIFAACARYSTTLFAELTSMSLDTDRYVHFERLQDLIDSDLTLMLHNSILERITSEDDTLKHYFHQPKNAKKIMNVVGMDTCLTSLLLHRNVSCFMEQGWAKLFAVNNMRDGETLLKTTKLCYLSPPTGYAFPKGSPYVRRVSDLLLMLTEGGIRDKWQRDYLRNETKETAYGEAARGQTSLAYVNVARPMFYILITGYSISALVFVGELMWQRLGVNLNVCVRGSSEAKSLSLSRGELMTD